jgi:hypothetical protein
MATQRQGEVAVKNSLLPVLPSVKGRDVLALVVVVVVRGDK